jgi:glutaredoxin
MSLKLILLNRSQCSLCERFLLQLNAALQRSYPNITLEVIDIDANGRGNAQTIKSAFTIAVPVLFISDIEAMNEICRYHLDHRKLAIALQH